MPTPDPANLTFYKAYCFRPLSPTYNEWARLTTADVHALKEWPEYEGQQTYFHLNHPIKWIRLVGVVVDFEAYANRFIMILDDSSGANIEITCGRLPPPRQDAKAKAEDDDAPAKDPPRMMGNTTLGHTVDLAGVDIGSVVKVKGGIGYFRGEKQMTLERLSFVNTTNEEAEAWAQNAAFRQDILGKPWVVSEQDERRAKRKMEGHEERRRVKEERRKKARLLEEAQNRRKRKVVRHSDDCTKKEKAVIRGHRDTGYELKPELRHK